MAIKEINYRDKNFEISYNIINPTKEKNIVILHGWGSNKEIMAQAFSDKLKDYRHIYIDLAGFGNSTNPLILTTKDYANIISKLLGLLDIKEFIAMGHSFGGKVATLLNPYKLILLSSAGVLTIKPWSIRIKIATVKLLKPLGFKKIRELFASPDASNLSHEMYETFKNVVDEDFEKSFASSKSRALCFWGKEDTATPLYTGEKIAGLIEKSEFFPLDGDHFFFLKHANFIAETVTQQCKDTGK